MADAPIAGDQISDGPTIVFKRAGWKTFSRWMMLVFLVGLNVSMPMSFLGRVLRHGHIQAGPELVQFLFLFACDLYLLPVCLLEPKSVTIKGEQIIISNLLWTARLTRATIVSFQMPKALTWALLRTGRCFYLINRADINNFNELASLIEQKLSQ